MLEIKIKHAGVRTGIKLLLCQLSIQKTDKGMITDVFYFSWFY